MGGAGGLGKAEGKSGRGVRCVPTDVERGEPVCSEHLSGGEGAVARFFSPLDLPSGRLEESLLFPEVYVEVP